MNEPSGALSGLVVVDLSATLASAYASLLYADYGAEVIVVEPLGGSTLRSQPAWPFWFRGKKSIELDFVDPDDLQTARRLAAGADVVFEAFRPGVADRLGLGYDALSAGNPGVIVTSINGFGSTGPYANLKAYEAVVMAKTGSMYGPNRSGRQGPVMQNAFGATMAGALLAIQGSLAALHERATSGRGQRVEASLMAGMLAQDPWTYFGRVLADLYPDAFSGVSPAAAPGRPVPTSWLSFGLLNGYTKDGRWMQFAHATPKQFTAFVKELGLEETLASPDFAGAPDSDDVELRERWWDLMLESVASKTMAEWQEVFDRNGDVFAEIYRGGTELLDHPQTVHDGNAVEVDVEGLGQVREMGPIAHLSKTPGSGTCRPPTVGEHTGELRSRPARVPSAGVAPPAPTGEAVDRGPLDGLLVVDLGTFYAGPFGSTMFADLGARVIKIEPLDGDPIRFNMPVPEWAGVRVTQGKESLAVDVFAEEGKVIVTELLRRADVVLHSYRGGVAARMGFDEASVRAFNPEVVYHHGQGYGVDGPYARRSAFAPTISAGSGFAVRSGGGGPEGLPLTLDERKAAIPYLAGAQSGHPDGFAALGVAAAMALNLVARDLGHGGQSSMTSMIATMGHVMGDVMIDHDGIAPPALPDDELRGFSALYRLYESADGWVVLCVTSDREWAVLAAEAGLGGNLRFATAADRQANDSALVDALTGFFAERSGSDWEKLFVAQDVACVEVVPQQGGLASGLMLPGGVAEQHGMTTTVEHPLFGVIPRTRALVQFSRSGESMRAGCLIGQHTDAILRDDLGYADDRIAELRAAGVIG